MFTDLPDRDVFAWLRDPVGRDIAVLTLLVSALSYLLEPQFNPIVSTALAVGYLIGFLRTSRQAQSTRVQQRYLYPRRIDYILAGAVGGMFVTGAVSMLIAILTSALFGNGHSRYNAFAVGMLLGGMLIGMRYVWKHTKSASE